MLVVFFVLSSTVFILGEGHEHRRRHRHHHFYDRYELPAEAVPDCIGTMKSLCGEKAKGWERFACIANHVDDEDFPSLCKAFAVASEPGFVCAQDVVENCRTTIEMDDMGSKYKFFLDDDDDDHDHDDVDHFKWQVKNPLSKVRAVQCLMDSQDKLSDSCRAYLSKTPAWNCKEDQAILCPDMDKSDLVRCMVENTAQLSPQCDESVSQMLAEHYFPRYLVRRYFPIENDDFHDALSRALGNGYDDDEDGSYLSYYGFGSVHEGEYYFYVRPFMLILVGVGGTIALLGFCVLMVKAIRCCKRYRARRIQNGVIVHDNAGMEYTERLRSSSPSGSMIRQSSWTDNTTV